MDRVDWIDTCRGLLILLVVMAHSFCPAGLFSYISYILPAFLFISGLLYKERSFTETLKKLFSSLIIPYLILGAFNVLIWFSTKPLIQDPGNEFSLKTVVISLFLVRTEVGQTAVNLIPLWFLPLLFTTEILYVILSRIRSVVPGIMIGVIGVSFMTGSLVWKFDVALVAMAFFAFGVFWRQHFGMKNLEHPVPVLCLSFLALVIIVSANGTVDMNADTYGKFPLMFYPAGFCIIFFLMAASKLLSSTRFSRPLRFCGRNTLFILGYHITAGALLYPIFDLLGEPLQLAAKFWYIYFLMEVGLLATMLMAIPENFRLFLSGELVARRNATRQKKSDPGKGSRTVENLE